MSRIEWERGTLKLSATQFRTLRNGLVEAYNAKNTPDEADAVYNELMELGFGKRRFDYTGEFNRLMAEKDLNFPVKMMIKENGKPRRPLKKDFPIANKKTDYYYVGTYGRIDVSFDPTGVNWVIAKGMNAVVNARDTAIGKAFFALLDGMEWSSRTGGVFIGSDENNIDEDGEANEGYVTGSYGKGK